MHSCDSAYSKTTVAGTSPANTMWVNLAPGCPKRSFEGLADPGTLIFLRLDASGLHQRVSVFVPGAVGNYARTTAAVWASSTMPSAM